MRNFAVLTVALIAGACAVPSPYRATTPPAPTSSGSAPVTATAPPAETSEAAQLPAPARREPTLSSASRALVTQAQTQVAAKNFPVAAASIERALRIEPDNPLLWIELAKVHQTAGNPVQAENMARKAISLSINAPRAQASAWRVISDAYRARGRNVEAREAQARAETLNR